MNFHGLLSTGQINGTKLRVYGAIKPGFNNSENFDQQMNWKLMDHRLASSLANELNDLMKLAQEAH